MKKINFILATLLLLSCSNTSSVEKSIPNTIESTNQNKSIEAIEKTEIVSNSISEETKKRINIPIKEVKESELIENKNAQVEEENNQAENFHDYIQWSAFLSQHVSSSGKVNYAKIKTNMKQLNAVIERFQKNLPSTSWSPKQRLAYWINAYNLFTLKLVADNYPISSITKISAKPWDKKFISLGEKTLSLNDIEHKKIRAKHNEPRIHFALNCASESCPILYNKAYTAKNLSYQLTKQTKRFLADKSKNDFSDPNNIKISSIFDWYKEDFIKKEGSVIAFINKYRTDQLTNPKISYLEYLWGLND